MSPSKSVPWGLFFKSLRPEQWTKNLFLFAGLLFSGNLFEVEALLRVVAAFGIFCLLSGAAYLFNDLVDQAQDRKHPTKSRRPLASGQLQPTQAQGFLAGLIPLCLVGAAYLGSTFFAIASGYLALQILYNFALKQTVILDVFAIAACFALRVLAGASVIPVDVSSWLLTCTIFLALFIALGKRRQELLWAQQGGSRGRKVLEEYSLTLLDQMISIVAAATLLGYVLYTLSVETIARFGTEQMVLTIPFVLYGILRYLYLIHQKGAGGEPGTTLFTDKPLLIAGLLWVAATTLILYG